MRQLYFSALILSIAFLPISSKAEKTQKIFKITPKNSLTKTLQQALGELKDGVPCKILLAPGTYREESLAIDFNLGKAAQTPLVIEGTKPNKVILDGSDEYKSSVWRDEGNGIYSTAWKHKFGNFFLSNANNNLIGHRAENVFINGKQLRQIIIEHYDYNKHNRSYTYKSFTPPEKMLYAGTFAVAERKSNGQRLYIFPPIGTDMSQAKILVGTRATLLEIKNKCNLTLRNLTFTRAANLLKTTPLQLTKSNRKTYFSTGFEKGGIDSLKLTAVKGSWEIVKDNIKRPGHTGSQFVAATKALKQSDKTLLAKMKVARKLPINHTFNVNIRLADKSSTGGIIVVGDNDKNGLIVKIHDNTAWLTQRRNGVEKILKKAKLVIAANDYCTITYEKTGTLFNIIANGVDLGTCSIDNPGNGTTFLYTDNSEALFDDLSIKANATYLTNIVLENCTFTYNSSHGARFADMRNMNLRNCTFNHNGYSGFETNGVLDSIIDGCQTNFNNSRGFAGGWTRRFIGGVKLHKTNDLILKNHTSFGNLCHGVWFDINCNRIEIDRLVSAANHQAGIFFEISKGPFKLTNSLLCENRKIGVQNITTHVTEISNNIISSSAGGAVEIQAYARRDTHWLLAPFIPKRAFLHNNIIFQIGNSASLIDFFCRYKPTDPRYKAFKNSYMGDSNYFYSTSSEANFRYLNKSLKGLSQWESNANEQQSSLSVNYKKNNGSPFDFTCFREQAKAKKIMVPYLKIPDSLLDGLEKYYVYAKLCDFRFQLPKQVSMPFANLLSGIYPQRVTLDFSCPTKGAAIRYTTDGTVPTENSPLFTKALNVPQSTMFRLRAFKAGMKPSNTRDLHVRIVLDKNVIIPVSCSTLRSGKFATTDHQGATTLSSKRCKNPDYHREAVISFDLNGIDVSDERFFLVLYCDMIRHAAGVKNSQFELYVYENKEIAKPKTWSNRQVKMQKTASFDISKDGQIILDITNVIKEFVNKKITLVIKGAVYESWAEFSSSSNSTRGPRIIKQKASALHNGALSPLSATTLRSGKYANTDFQNEPLIEVKRCKGKDYHREAVLNFDLSALKQNTQHLFLQLTCKELTLAQEENSGNFSVYIYETPENAATLTWSSRQKKMKKIASFIIKSPGSVKIDLSPAMKELKSKQISLVIKGDDYETWGKFCNMTDIKSAPKIIFQ